MCPQYEPLIGTKIDEIQKLLPAQGKDAIRSMATPSVNSFPLTPVFKR
jgi:hypothetical protein